MAGVRVRIVGEKLPGRQFCEHGNVHVGVQRGSEVVQLVPGDAPSAVFEFDVVRRDDGDFRGPFVHGKPGDRFLYLSWGDVAPDGSFEMFRRAKLMLAAVPRGLLGPGTTMLEGYLPLTDDKGGPVCAAVRPPSVNWFSS